MNKDIILQMKNQLDSLVQTIQEEHIEFWFARDFKRLSAMRDGKILSPQLIEL